MKFRLNYRQNDSPLSVGNMLESALRRRTDIELSVNGGKADVVFNTLPYAEYTRGSMTIWWDIESCSYNVTEQFNSDIVLTPYSYKKEIYPNDRTFLFPFATDPTYWDKVDISNQYDVVFVGREDLDRLRRVEYLDYFQANFKGRFLRTKNIPRGQEVSRLISSSKIFLQISGDAGHVMETRCFEPSLCAVLCADRVEANQSDLDRCFSPTRDYIPYTTKEEMLDKVNKALAKPDSLNRMLKSMRKNILLNHTYDARVQQLFDHLNGKTLPQI